MAPFFAATIFAPQVSACLTLPPFQLSRVRKEKLGNDQGSMLWSKFSPIFTNFRRKNWLFSQKPMLWSQFLQKLAVVLAKNANNFAKFFGKNILKSHNIGPRCVRQKLPKMYLNQGDQNGRIFAQWVSIYFGQWFENDRKSSQIWATFFTLPIMY
jgi:hypothetical protein